MNKFFIFLLDYKFFSNFGKERFLSLLMKLVIKRDYDFTLTDEHIDSLKPYEFYSILLNKVLKLDRTDLKLIRDIQRGKTLTVSEIYYDIRKFHPYLMQVYIHPCLMNLSLSKQQRRLISEKLLNVLSCLALPQGKTVECNNQFIQRHLKNGCYNPVSQTISINLLDKDKDFYEVMSNEDFGDARVKTFADLKKMLSYHQINLSEKRNFKKSVPNYVKQTADDC